MRRTLKGDYRHIAPTDIEGIIMDPSLSPPRPVVDPGHLSGSFLSKVDADTAEGDITFNKSITVSDRIEIIDDPLGDGSGDIDDGSLRIWSDSGAITLDTDGFRRIGWNDGNGNFTITTGLVASGIVHPLATGGGNIRLQDTGAIELKAFTGVGGGSASYGPILTVNTTSLTWDGSQVVTEAAGKAYDSARLDGLTQTTSATASTIMARTSNGYAYATYFNGGYNDGSSLIASGSRLGFQNSDGFLRFASRSSFEALMGTYLDTPNTLVRRDSSGDMNARLFRSDYPNIDTSMSGAYSITYRRSASDNYLRQVSKEGLANFLSSYAGGLLKNSGDEITGTTTLDGGTVLASGTSAYNAIRSSSNYYQYHGGWANSQTFIQAGANVHTTHTAYVQQQCYDDVRGWKTIQFYNDPNNTYAYFRCTVDNQCYLGSSTRRWRTIYSSNGTINTSDERLKDFEDIGDTTWIYSLEPKAYRWKEGSKLRLGFSAQDVYSKMPQEDMDLIDVPENPEEFYGMNMTELIAPMLKEMQKMRKEIKELKEKLGDV